MLVQVDPGNTSAAQETERAIAHFDPQFALFAGIAGGVKDVTLGDVVVSSKVYNYEKGADHQSLRPRPDIGLPSYALLQLAGAVARDNSWRSRRGTILAPPCPDPKVFVGPIAAGEKVVKTSAGAVATLLAAHYGDALAVEMEGAGFMRAAYASRVDALVIRGISDFLDDKTRTDASGWQPVAADNAAAFAFELLSELGSAGGSVARGLGRSASGGGQSVPDPVDPWQRLIELAPRLYPKGPEQMAIWEGAGGDVARLNLQEDGRTQWFRALRLLQKGGGGSDISPASLLARMLSDFGSNPELQYLEGRLK
jgi:nucleoside phosphorylase